MARYTKTGTPNTIGQLNSELDLIALAIADTVSRVGDVPNQLETTLDANSNRILNLPRPISGTDPLRLMDIEKSTVTPLILPFTTSDLILNTEIYTVYTVLQVSGFYLSGDGPNAFWMRNGVTGQTPSQSPSQLSAALLNDGLGNQWSLVGKLNLVALGGTSADVTGAYNAAVGAINSGVKAAIYLPAGDYNINPVLTNKIVRVNATIEGDGMSLSRFLTSADGGIVTEYEKNGGNRSLSIKDISYVANVGTTSIAIQAEDVSLGVNGGEDTLIISNVEVEAGVGTWWSRHILMIEAGGLVINYGFFRNATAAAQNDVNTVSLEVRNVKAGVSIIRAIDTSHLYIQRANTCVLVSAVNSIESVYFNSGEMVGADYGLRTEGIGKVGAVKIDVHMDCIKRNILANSLSFNFAKILGDLRLSDNGAALDPTAINCEFNSNVEMMMATGSTSSGASHTGSVAYKFNGNLIQSQIDPQIRANAEGINMTSVGTVFGVSSDPTFSNSVVSQFVNIPDAVFRKGYQTAMEDFTGNVNDLFATVSADGVRRVESHSCNGATGLPAGVDTTGTVITTYGVDSNAGHQIITPFNTDRNFNYVRTKRAGTIGAWSRQGANVNGTFTSPSSITVENGIITAIS